MIWIHCALVSLLTWNRKREKKKSDDHHDECEHDWVSQHARPWLFLISCAPPLACDDVMYSIDKRAHLPAHTRAHTHVPTHTHTHTCPHARAAAHFDTHSLGQARALHMPLFFFLLMQTKSHFFNIIIILKSLLNFEASCPRERAGSLGATHIWIRPDPTVPAWRRVARLRRNDDCTPGLPLMM